MTVTLQFVFIFVSILTLIFALIKIRHSKLHIQDSIVWIIGSIFLVLLSIFSEAVIHVASFLGFYSASNFILTMFIFFLLVLVFKQSIKLSLLNEKVKELNHYIALKDKEKDDEN